MRKTNVKENTCSVCSHGSDDHIDDGEFYVECKVSGCDCSEYDEY